MKKLLLAITLTLTVSFLWAQDHENKGNTGQGVGEPIPEFAFTATDGQLVTRNEMPQGQPGIVFYFDTDCDHCQMEAQWVNENADMFKGITLLWVSWSEMEDIAKFQAERIPNVKSDIFFTKDTEYKFDDYFGYSEIPSIYVYNKMGVRTAAFKGETKPEILVKFARQ